MLWGSGVGKGFVSGWAMVWCLYPSLLAVSFLIDIRILARDFACNICEFTNGFSVYSLPLYLIFWHTIWEYVQE